MSKINVSNVIDSRTKIYEQVCIFKNDKFDEIKLALSVVRQFIIDRKLLIYGGMAIDFALRLHGDKIYEDDAIPDYDFLSPNHVSDTYDLTDILYDTEGITGTELSCKPAVHIGTMTIKLHNTPIADISYIEPDLFKFLNDKYNLSTPDLVRFVHPTYQYIDLHSALAFPFQNSPMEAIFHRLKKDITRLRILREYYTPKEDTSELPKYGKISDIAGRDIVPTAMTAFSVYNHLFGSKDTSDVLFGERVEEIVDIPQAELPDGVDINPRNGNLIPPHWFDKKTGGLSVNTYGDQFLLADEISKNGNLIKLPNVNLIMTQLLGFYFVFKKKYYLTAYNKLVKIVLSNKDKRLGVYIRPEKLFGRNNISVIHKFKLSKMAETVGRENIQPDFLMDLSIIPRGYSPTISRKYNLDRPDKKK